jgi:hypothetical protein
MRRALEGLGSAVFFMVIIGCADREVPAPPVSIAPPPPPAVLTTKAFLAEPRTFSVGSSSTAQVTASDGASGDTATLALSGGTITLQADEDGNLAILAIDVSVGDVHLPVSATLPDGLDLMAVKLSLPAIADVAADWSGDASAMNAQAKTDLALDWDLRSKSGTVVPLATQRITNVPFDLAVTPAPGGKPSVDFHASRDGVFWTFSTLFSLSDLKLDLEGQP